MPSALPFSGDIYRQLQNLYHKQNYKGGASLIAQLVKNPPAMQETPGQSLGWEDPLENGKATHSGIPAWRIPWNV